MTDGLQALEATLKLKPDVLVLDISMPVMNGIEVARRVNRGYISAALAGGLTKPVTPKQKARAFMRWRNKRKRNLSILLPSLDRILLKGWQAPLPRRLHINARLSRN